MIKKKVRFQTYSINISFHFAVFPLFLYVLSEDSILPESTAFFFRNTYTEPTICSELLVSYLSPSLTTTTSHHKENET